VVIVLAVGAADFIASGILKDLVARPRPTRVPELEGVLHLVNNYRSGQYGFVSSHAANTMACGLLFSLIWRKKIATVGLMLWVAMNCYSRMYLGVHYPLDIMGGLLVGALVAVAAYVALRVGGVVYRGDGEQSNCMDSVEYEAVD
jgi:undecaprenyl-diphosphatase